MKYYNEYVQIEQNKMSSRENNPLQQQGVKNHKGKSWGIFLFLLNSIYA